MSSQQVPPSLREILADILEISPEMVTPDLGMETIDSWDSFRHLQAILAIEGEYGVQFDPQQIPELTTVSHIQKILEEKGVKL